MAKWFGPKHLVRETLPSPINSDSLEALNSLISKLFGISEILRTMFTLE